MTGLSPVQSCVPRVISESSHYNSSSSISENIHKRRNSHSYSGMTSIEVFGDLVEGREIDVAG